MFDDVEIDFTQFDDELQESQANRQQLKREASELKREASELKLEEGGSQKTDLQCQRVKKAAARAFCNKSYGYDILVRDLL